MGALDITLRGAHVDNSGLRLAGWLVFLRSLAGGAATIALGTIDQRLPNDAFIAGLVIAGVGTVVGIPFMAANSGLRLSFEPG